MSGPASDNMAAMSRRWFHRISSIMEEEEATVEFLDQMRFRPVLMAVAQARKFDLPGGGVEARGDPEFLFCCECGRWGGGLHEN